MKKFSHSKLAVYERCPLHFKLQYLTNLKPEQESTAEAFTGGTVHKVLEVLYRDLMKTKLNSLEELLEFYRKEWEASWNDKIKYDHHKLTPKEWYEYGRKCIKNYYQQYYPFDQDTTIGVEKNLSMQWGDYTITGVIDRLSREQRGVYAVHDYKTGQLMDQKYADLDRQLALYAIWVHSVFSEAKEVKLVWHYVAVGEDVVSARTEGQLKELKSETLALIMDIDRAIAESNFPARENKCEWCGYWQYCPKKKHLYKTEQLPENEYLKEGGVNLAKKYIELTEQRSAINKKANTERAVIEAEMLKVQDAILKYAEAKEIEVLDGGEKVVVINKKTGYAVPTKSSDPEAYAALETLLKDTEYWSEISSVNSNKLNILLEESRLESKLKKKIIELAPEDTGLSLSVKKK